MTDEFSNKQIGEENQNREDGEKDENVEYWSPYT